jgi:hypothetical protein
MPEVESAHRALNLRPGELVRVRSPKEIFLTLDDRSALEGFPFMPEMLQYCGRIFSTFKWTDKTCGHSLTWLRRVHGAEEIDLARHALSLDYRIEYTEGLYTDHHPSEERRDYQAVRITERLRLFATTKAYWCNERAPAKAVVYAALVSLRLVRGAVRRDAREAFGGIALAARLALAAATRGVLTRPGETGPDARRIRRRSGRL